MSRHIVNYDENSDGSRSRALCSCGDAQSWQRGPATETYRAMDAWAEAHIEAKS